MKKLLAIALAAALALSLAACRISIAGLGAESGVLIEENSEVSSAETSPAGADSSSDVSSQDTPSSSEESSSAPSSRQSSSSAQSQPPATGPASITPAPGWTLDKSMDVPTYGKGEVGNISLTTEDLSDYRGTRADFVRAWQGNWRDNVKDITFSDVTSIKVNDYNGMQYTCLALGMKLWTIFLFQNSTAYVIQCEAEDESLYDSIAGDFQRMVNSFTLGGGSSAPPKPSASSQNPLEAQPSITPAAGWAADDGYQFPAWSKDDASLVITICDYPVADGTPQEYTQAVRDATKDLYTDIVISDVSQKAVGSYEAWQYTYTQGGRKTWSIYVFNGPVMYDIECDAPESVYPDLVTEFQDMIETFALK